MPYISKRLFFMEVFSLLTAERSLNVFTDMDVKTENVFLEVPFAAGKTVEFLDREENHIPLQISDMRIEEKKGLCVSLQCSPELSVFPEMTPGEKVSFYSLPAEAHPILCTGTVLSASHSEAEIVKISCKSIKNKRRDFRLPLRGSVILFDGQDPDESDRYVATLINVSAGGLAFCAKKDFQVGSVFGVSFHLYPGGPLETFHGQILWTQKLPSGQRTYGMIFSRLAGEQRNRLLCEIYKAQQVMRE